MSKEEAENSDLGSSEERDRESSLDRVSCGENGILPEKQYLSLLAKVQLYAWKVDEALTTYKKANEDPPKEDLLYVGNAAMYECQYETAFKVYRAAGARGALTELGNVARALGHHNIAINAFREAGEQIPQDIQDIEHDAEKEEAHEINAAAKPNIDAKERATLIVRGDEALERGDLDTATHLYQRAGERDKLIACGEAAFEKGWIAVALDAYAAADERVPEKRLNDAIEQLQRREYVCCALANLRNL